MEGFTNGLADQLLEDLSDKVGLVQAIAAQFGGEQGAATSIRSETSRNSCDLTPIH